MGIVPSKLVRIKVAFESGCLPNLKGEWQPGEDERKAAWEMYVELVTRISVVELKDQEGLLREALNSLYALFGITRDILKRYGPSVARPDVGSLSFGKIAVQILNNCLRPFLAKWHPILLHHENSRDSVTSPAEHEKSWKLNSGFRNELKDLQEVLYYYSEILSQVTGVSIHKG